MNFGISVRQAGAVVIPLLLCIHLLISSASAQESFTVEWQDAHLSVSAKAAPLASLLGKVARLTGLEIRGLAGLQETVDVEFSRLPLREGLKTLLASVNSVIFEEPCCGGGTRPTRVFVSRREGPSPVEAPPEDRAIAEQELSVSVVIDGKEEGQEEGPAVDVVIYEEEGKTREGN